MLPVSYRSRHLALSHVRKVGLFKTVALLLVGMEPQSLITVPSCVIRSKFWCYCRSSIFATKRFAEIPSLCNEL